MLEEFEKIRYNDDSLTEEEQDERQQERIRIIKSLTDEEFKILLDRTQNIQAKIFYNQIRKSKENKES